MLHNLKYFKVEQMTALLRSSFSTESCTEVNISSLDEFDHGEPNF